MNNDESKLSLIVKTTHSTFNENPPDKTKQLICAALGLTGESAEWSEHVKKWYEQGHQLNEEKMALELFDVLYYTQLACLSINRTFTEIIILGEEKLKKRYPNGFNTSDSEKRNSG